MTIINSKKINILNIIPVIFLLGNFVSLEDGYNQYIFLALSIINIIFFAGLVFNNQINLNIDRKIFNYIIICISIFFLSILISLQTQNIFRLTFLMSAIFVCHASTYLGDNQRIFKNILNSIFTLSPIILFSCIIYSGFSFNRIEGFMGNPNSLARFCTFLIPFYFIYPIKALKKYKKLTLKTIFNILILLLLYITTLSTNSRGALVLIFVQFIAFFTYNFELKHLIKFKYNSIIKNIIFLITLVLLISNFYYFGLFDGLINKMAVLREFKMSNDGIGVLDITNGRTNLAVQAWPFIKDNLFGIDIKLLNPLATFDAHNNYINFAVKYGFFSSIAYHSIFVYFQFYFYLAKDKNIINLIGFITNSQILIYWFFETASVIYPVWLVIILYTISKKNIFEKYKKQAILL